MVAFQASWGWPCILPDAHSIGRSGEQRGEKPPRLCFALAQSPSVHRNKRTFRKRLVSTCPWRCKEIRPTSSLLPLPLSPLHSRRWWQCLADTLSVSPADAEEGSLPGVAEVRDLVTLGLERRGGSSLSVSEPCWDCVSLFPAVLSPLCHRLSLPLPVSEGSVCVLTWEVARGDAACPHCQIGLGSRLG